jgi:TPR repeat protein
MAEIDQAETNEPSGGEYNEFNRVIQDIREMRERYDSRPALYRRARSAEETEIPSEESLPLFLSSPVEQDRQPAGQDTRPSSTRDSSVRESSNWPSSTLTPSTLQQDARPENPRLQAARQQPAQRRDARQQDTQQQDTWLHDVTESDHDDMQTFREPSFLRRTLKAGILAATVAAALAAAFTLQDHRGLISNASASLAAVLPGFSSGIARPAPAKEQIAATASVATSPAPVVTAAVVPSREAISVAYQTALQSQPEIRQPPVAAAAPAVPPAPAPAARRLDPDELAMLLKRAQGLIDLGDFPGARLLLERAADAHEAKAAFILAQTYDPAVLGTADARSVAPNPEAARLWYQKAAEFGSPEAQQRLAQMQN